MTNATDCQLPGSPHRCTLRGMRRLILTGLILGLLPGCSLHGTATHWNGRVGIDGETVFVKNTTNVGVNLFVGVPLFGSTTMDRMIDSTTGAIAEVDGNKVRVIETSNENYCYGFPPFTWILTPVITSVSIEYQPSAKERAAVAAERR